MNWYKEFIDSMTWVGSAFAISIVLMIVIGYLLIRTTRWASQFWQIAYTYFNPIKNPLAILNFAVILFLSLFGVRVSVLFSNWYNNMYTALQEKDESTFWLQMLVFSVLAIIHIFRSLIALYMQQAFTIRWREDLNERVLGKWLRNKNYYRLFFLKHQVDNPDQRIQQDVASFVGISLSLVLGLITSMVSVVAFTVILWNLSGPMNVFGVELSKGLVFILFVYVLIATVFAFKIGRPLIRLNFLDERLNANYRYSLIRVREYAESVAFYGGEKVEGFKLTQRFKGVIENVWNIVFRSLKFQGFNFIVSQTAVIFPFILQAPRFFSGQITLGAMIQTADAFGNLQSNLSFFRTAYDDFAGFKAVLDRLTEFMDALDEAEELPHPEVVQKGDEVVLNNVTITTPNGRVLVKNLAFDVQPGEALLIRGPSGTGKTTILRTVAGLWPYAEGDITCPKEDALFLSQKPYLPEGHLIDVLYYPFHSPDNAHEEAIKVLELVNLGHLVHRIDEVNNWMHILSLGEQQRVAFGRMLLTKPDVVFLDEATSAMDEGLEYYMYKLIRERLPEMRLISVGHRSTLLAHHSHILNLSADATWYMQTCEEALKEVSDKVWSRAIPGCDETKGEA
ncbi:ABC transporter ATP-binding protein/permease [Oligella ureolytica]|nr:ABC transporter ATP-binding protein/permease [Alcaligenaceae bacterium]HZJ96760.1 ABC transporter ATP-binding protein/permease [Oligella sp.]